MPISQRTVQICLFLLAAIALAGGVLQISLGQPDTAPRLDNVHRFLAGIYLGCGIIAAWAALTIRQQGTLIYLIALAVFIAGIGRLMSMAKVGLPAPHALWLAYVGSELLIPCIMVAAQYAAVRRRWDDGGYANENRMSQLFRFLPAMVAFLLPIVFAVVVMQYNVRLVLPDTDLWQTVSMEAINPANYERFTRDLETRFVYATVNAFGQLAAVASVVLAAAVVMGLFDSRAAIIVTAAAVLFGFLISILSNEQQDLIRTAILDKTLLSAQRAGFTFAHTVESLKSAVQLNMSVGLAGTAALLAGFGAVAVRMVPQDLEHPDSAARRLRARVQYLKLLTFAGAAILVLLVAANKVVLGWPQGLMKPEAAKSYGVLTAAVANFWGGIGTGVLLCALIPALFSIKADVARAAEFALPDYSEQEKWRKANDLEFAISSVLPAALTTAAPLFAGPAIDVVKALLGGG